MMDGPILTVREASKFLRVHPSTIYRLLKARKIPAFRVGSDWRFQGPELEKWLNQQTAESMIQTKPFSAPSRRGRHPVAA